jgi:hypothetical protein
MHKPGHRRACAAASFLLVRTVVAPGHATSPPANHPISAFAQEAGTVAEMGLAPQYTASLTEEGVCGHEEEGELEQDLSPAEGDKPDGEVAHLVALQGRG